MSVIDCILQVLTDILGYMACQNAGLQNTNSKGFGIALHVADGGGGMIQRYSIAWFPFSRNFCKQVIFDHVK